ncbi:MAG: 50S ribosomal protein L10 [Bdellovibrionaceae bacterium]|nr:50S ribosomal protein L10 [Pseudobdellovibrionaceae bacterium]
MITRSDKEQQVSALREKFAKSKGAFVVDFKGMKVEQVTSLRKKLHASEAEMKVVRNTLAKIAFKGHPGVEQAFGSIMQGTNAIVFAYGEVNAAAKTLSDFGKEVEVLQIKSGVMDGAPLDEAKIKFLASLPGKDQLRAQFLGLLKEPGAKLARCLKAYVDKEQGGAAAPT